MSVILRVDRREFQHFVRSSGYSGIAVIVAVLLGSLLTFAMASEGKSGYVVLAALFALGCWPIVAYFPGYIERILLLALSATLSVSLKFHLAFRPGHFGGAIGYRISITEILAVLILVSVAWGMSRRRRDPIRIDKPLLLAFGAYLFFAALSAFASDDVQVGLYQLSALVTAFLLFVFLCNYLNSRERIRIFVGGLLLGMVLQSAVAIIQAERPGALNLKALGAVEETETTESGGNINLPDVDLGTTSIGGEVTRRPTGLLIHPNLLALYLVLMIPLALAAWLASGEAWLEWLGFGALCLGAGTLYLTLSRSGWAGMLTALALASIYWMKGKLPRFASAKKFLLVVICLVALGGIGMKAEKIYLRLTESASEAVEFRTILANAALSMLAENPALGVGLNNFINHVAQHDASGLSRQKRYPVHNIVLMEFSETGLLGGIAFLVLVMVLTVRTFRWSLVCQDPLYRMVGLFLACGLAGFWVAEMTGFASRVPIMTSLLWCCAGLIYAMRRVDTEARV